MTEPQTTAAPASPDVILIERIATQVARAISRPIPVEVDLWSSVEASQYLKMTPKHFRQCVAVLPSFPGAIRMPTTTGGQGNPLWRASEVIAWALQFQDRMPRTRKR